MEEEKAAAYYDELTRKGGGAARFKQGLGFSTPAHEGEAVPTKQASSSSFLSNFVKASSSTTTSNLQKQSELQSIQNKLKKKQTKEEQAHSSRVSRDRERDLEDRDRERNGDYREKDHRHRDRERYRGRDYRDKDRERDGGRDHRDRDRQRERRRRRSASPQERREERKARKERSDKVDYSRLIEGYDKMTPAERVKAKMKHQLAETAEKDETMGMGSGWERFEFDKDAPLDDEELEAAEDDVALVKHIGQSFRFSAIEARREEQIKAAHDEAMFGASAVPPSISSESEPEADNGEKKSNEGGLATTSLLSEKVLAKQQGSWRDRARKG